MDAAALFARFTALPPRVRVMSFIVPAVIAAVSLLAAAISHPSRMPLFATPLHAEQLSEVEERLAAWNVPFAPAADNVIVDGKRRSDLLLRLSMAGVPHAHIDASGDVLAKLGALTPQSVVEAQTRDGLAGDIELGLRGIEGIQDARVIIAPAKAGYFADETSRDASASVRLRLETGARLTADAISGVRSFVAASVPGLDRRNVTIVDDRGVALEESGGDDAPDLQRSLQSALDTALGAGAAIVRVHVDYDRRTSSSRDVRRTPLASVPVASTTQDERFDGEGKRYERSSQQSDRGSDTREDTTSSPPGRIARISAAVLLSADRSADLPQVKSLAQAALGLDARRGDTIDVEAVQFSRGVPAKKDGWWLAYGAIVPLLPTLAVIVAALVSLRWAHAPASELVKNFADRAAIARTTAQVSGVAPAGVRGVLEHEPPHTAAAIISALPAATAAAVLDMYPEHERAAIIRRMQRPASPLLAGMEDFVRDA